MSEKNWLTCENATLISTNYSKPVFFFQIIIIIKIKIIIPNAFGTVTKGLQNALEDLKVGGRVEDHPNYCIIENGQNTEKSPVDLRRLAVHSNPSERSSANADVEKL